jgi:hypothetical protein
MTSTTYFRYYDDRFGDIYEINTDSDGNFVSAQRSVEAIGRDTIYYDDLKDIPPLHRNAIEHMIAERVKKDGQ